MSIRSLIGALLALTLAACASLPAGRSGGQLPPERAERLAALQSWSLRGRVSVIDGEDGWHGTLNWTHEGPDAYRLDIIGPLGQGRVTVISTAEGVLLRSEEGEQRAADPETLVAQTLGVALPVSGLIDWVKGLPTDAPVDRLTLDDAGRTLELEQQGWTLRYLGYADVDGVDLPSRLNAVRDTVTVKLAVGTWRIDS